MNGSELYQYILDNTLHELRGTWEVTQDNELKVTGINVNGSYVVFPDALTNFSLEWDMTVLSSGGYINSGISPILLTDPTGSSAEGWNNGTITNAKFVYFMCNYTGGGRVGTLNFISDNGPMSSVNSATGSFTVGTKYTYKLVRANGYLRLYQDNNLISEYQETIYASTPFYLGWYMWYGGTQPGYQANFIIDNYIVTDLSTNTTKYLNGTGLSEVWANNKNYIAAQLLGKSNTGHTHTKSEITDFPTIPTKTSDLTNDSGFLTSHQDLSGYVPRSGGAVMTGGRLGTTVNNGVFWIYGGTDWFNSGSILLCGKDRSDVPEYAGTAILGAAKSETIRKWMIIYPDGTWTWDGTAVQLVSDARLKQQITKIDDKLLDAWQDVNLVQFKYNDAVDAKKDKARLHTGYVVQQIDKACKSHGVDISAYGLYCHEEHPQETEEVEVKQADGTKTKERKVIREASEHYSLRYTEVYAVECMYLRRCIKQLTARIEQLEKGNNTK